MEAGSRAVWTERRGISLLQPGHPGAQPAGSSPPWIRRRPTRGSRGRGTRVHIASPESAFLALSEPCTRVIVCAQDAFDPARYEAWHTQAVSYRELALAWEPA